MAIIGKECFPVSLRKNGFTEFKLMLYQVPGDGDCFFHSLFLAFFVPYRTLRFGNGKKADRSQIVRKFRRELAIVLSRKLENKNLILYDYLSRGKLREYSRTVPEYSLENMKRMLKSYSFVGQEVLELTSIICDKDIYIIDQDTEDVYITGDASLFYKKRPSIVILYVGKNHYDLIGLQCGSGEVVTHFSPDNPFIKFLRRRISLIEKCRI